MNPKITTLEPPARNATSRNILSKDGFNCSIVTLAPSDEVARLEPSQVEEHLLFVVEGEVVVRWGEVNTILNQEEALLIPKGKAHSIKVHASRGARILQIDVPPRQIVTPPILSFDAAPSRGRGAS